MPIHDSLDATLTVNELLQRFPDAIATLSSYGIDTCCRGGQSLATAAAFAGVDPDRILAEISGASAGTAPTRTTKTTKAKASCDCGCSHSCGDAA